MTVSGERLSRLPPEPRWLPWTETLLLTAAGPVAGHFLRPDDPLCLHSSFCWPMVGPLLAALRYGLVKGATGASVLLAGMALDGWRNVPGQLACGIVVLTMITGELTDRWRRQAARAERIARHATTRTDAFVRVYHALNASHDRLLREAQTSGSSLREALSALRLRVACGVQGEEETATLHATILELFAEFAGAQIAAYHPVDPSGHLLHARTTLGDAERAASHPMLVEAQERGEVVCIRLDAEDAGAAAPVAAVPLVTVDGRVLAVISIQELPFVRLQEGTMQLLAVLAGRAADVLADYGRPSPQLEAWQFVTALERCLSDRRVHRLAASLAVVSVAIPEAAATIVELSAERRAHDRTWLTSADDGEALLLILLPLTALEGGQCFARRLQDLMRARYGQLSGFSVSVREIQPDDSVDTLIAFTRDSRENRAPARPPAGLRRS